MQQSTLYVGNLASSTTQFAVEKAFSAYEYDEILLVSNWKTGRSRRYAYIYFATQHDAETALEMNGKFLGGRNMIVDFRDDTNRNGLRGHR